MQETSVPATAADRISDKTFFKINTGASQRFRGVSAATNHLQCSR